LSLSALHTDFDATSENTSYASGNGKISGTLACRLLSMSPLCLYLNS
jgi:hypothetical protein